MSILKTTLLKVPVIGRPIINIIWTIKKKFISFDGSGNYWEKTYITGGNSGEGSYNNLSEFKADIINEFIQKNQIQTIIEFGCGDGNQLKLIKYPYYIGLDVSPTIVNKCIQMFESDTTKSFFLYNSLSFKDNAKIFNADLTLSLDVIYHLIEDEIFNKYMTDLFNASKKYVVIYSSNYNTHQNHHERDRKFTDWVEANEPRFELISEIKNKYPFDKHNPEYTSKADFFIYRKIR